MMKDDLLEQAISLYKSGNKKSASEVLKKLLRQNLKNEAAWLWLSACVETDEKKQYCLQKALEINPGNQKAKDALQRLTKLTIQQTTEVPSRPHPVPKISTPEPVNSQTFRQVKPKKKRNKVVTFFAFLAFLVLAFGCFLGAIRNVNQPNQTPSQPEQISTQRPTATQKLFVQPGTLSQYESQIAKETVVNVYKKNGTLDEREGDLKELCLDWLYYRAKILEYASSGENDKADDARERFNSINAWLDEYEEVDVETMFSIIEKNK